MDERPAPAVTITDPRRPAVEGDVLLAGDEKPPWRAQRRHYEAVALVVALALAVLVPQRVVAGRAAERRATTAAIDAADVAVSLGTDADRSSAVRAALTNEGPDAVTLVSMQLQGPGYGPLPLGGTLATGSSATVAVPDTRTCSEDLVSGLSVGLSDLSAVLRFRVAGRALTRTVPVASDLHQALVDAAARRCGYLPAGQALGIRLSLRPSADGVAVTLHLTNSGRLPLLVTSASALTEGLEVPPGLQEVVVPPRASPRTFAFGLRVTDCGKLRFALTDSALVGVQLDAQVELARGGTAGDSVQLTDRFPALARAVVALGARRCGSS